MSCVEDYCRRYFNPPPVSVRAGWWLLLKKAAPGACTLKLKPQPPRCRMLAYQIWKLPMRKAAISAAALFTALGLAWLAAQPAGAETERVVVGSNYFCAPSFEREVCTTTVTVGDTVTWDVSQFTHTVTECIVPTFINCAGGFDSGLLTAGETFSQTFDVAGSHDYYCAVHPIEMRGVVVVIAAATDTPTPVPGPPTDSPGVVSPTATPAVLPETGGEPGAYSFPLELLILALSGALTVVGAGTFYAWQRGERQSRRRCRQSWRTSHHDGPSIYP